MVSLKGQFRPASKTNYWPGSDGIGIVYCKGILYKIGGWNTAFAAPFTTNRVDMSPDLGRTWFPLPNAPFTGRHTFPLVELNGKIYVVGGDMNSGVYQKGVWEGTPSEWGIRWRQVIAVAAPLAQGRVGHICWAFEGKIVLGFGQTLDEFIPNPSDRANKPGSPYYDDIWSWTPGDADFIKLADNMGIAPFAFMLGSPVKDGKMWLVGGGAYETQGLPRVYGNRVHSGTLAGFTQVSANGGFSPCMYNSVAVHGDDLVTAFGWNGANMTQIAASPTGSNFRQIANPTMQARHASSVVAVPGEILVMGGPLTDTAVWAIS